MSETVFKAGFIRQVATKNEIDRFISSMGYETDDEFFDDHYDNYFVSDKFGVFKIEYTIDNNYSDGSGIVNIDDFDNSGVYYFAACYYNGGTCLSEILEELLDEV